MDFKDLLNPPVPEKKTAGQRIKDNLTETKNDVKESLVETRDDFLVWLLSTFTGWLLILSVIGFVALWISEGFGIAIGAVAAVWIIRLIFNFLTD